MRAKNLHPKEEDEQIRFVVWLKKKGVRVAASANGGSRRLLEALKLKNMGVSAGFPDLFIPKRSGPHIGCFIEMKRATGGRVSPEQLEWLTYLREVGYFCAIAHGCDQAIEIFENYLALPDPHPVSAM